MTAPGFIPNMPRFVNIELNITPSYGFVSRGFLRYLQFYYLKNVPYLADAMEHYAYHDCFYRNMHKHQVNGL